MSVVWAWATVVLGVVALLAFSSPRRGDIISPFTVIVLLLVSIFGVRPILTSHETSLALYGVDFRRGFETATLVGLAALLTFTIGFAHQRGKRTDGPGAAPGTSAAPAPPGAGGGLTSLATAPLAYYYAAGSLLLGLWAAVLFSSGPGAFEALLNGRTTALVGASTLPVVVPALPAAGAVVVAYGRLTIGRDSAVSLGWRALYWLLIALCALPSAFSGSRRFLLPVVIVGLLGAWSADLGRRVSVWAVGAFALAFVFVSAVPFVRSTGSRAGESLGGSVVAYVENNGVVGALRNVFVSYDTEMFDYVALISTKLGTQLDYGLGRGTIGEALLVPLPRRFAPISTWSDSVLTTTFGGPCGAGGACPVPSVPGTLYYDFGFVGVVVGMYILGRAVFALQRRLAGARGVGMVLVLVGISSVPSVFRGNPISQLWISFNILMVCVLVLKAVAALRPTTQFVHPPRTAERR